ITTGWNNIIIGYGQDVASATGSNQLNIAGILTSSDYTTGNLVVGTSDTTGQLLVLDTKTDSGDPTGVNGGMYYNSDAGQFMFYENGAWRGLDAAGATVTLQSAYDGGNSITTTDSRNILFTLDNTTTDSNFIVDIASGSSSAFKIQNGGSDRFSIDNDNAIFTQN